MDLEIQPGQTVALVGETGAGKSTVIKLLTRFYDPTIGKVLIDGVDLRLLDLPAYRHQLGYVPQEAHLFSGTIRDNIAYGRPDATDAEVEAAARAVGAHELVAGLAGGYLHRVTERGRSLSNGQRQLVALARAELVNPALLLLDEATSNLDLATESRVARAMGVVASGRTTVLIAHRLQTARRADRIVVLDRRSGNRGRVARGPARGSQAGTPRCGGPSRTAGQRRWPVRVRGRAVSSRRRSVSGGKPVEIRSGPSRCSCASAQLVSRGSAPAGPALGS